MPRFSPALARTLRPGRALLPFRGTAQRRQHASARRGHATRSTASWAGVGSRRYRGIRTVYRYPGVLAKIVTTLDVLSGGRAWLGIGAAWNEQESRGLGIGFPPVGERFERLEETLQICLQMWRGDQSRYRGKHYRLGRPLNSPQALTRPHPPIMIGGGGEKKTLRLAARYAGACNLFPGPDLARKLDVLRAHCDAEGRDYDEITKTCYFIFDVGAKGEKTAEVIDQLGRLAEMGFGAAIGAVANVWQATPLEVIAADVIPAVAGL